MLNTQDTHACYVILNWPENGSAKIPILLQLSHETSEQVR